MSAYDELSTRHKLFVDEYILNKGNNAKKAYIDAGYKARGNAAESGASRLMKKDKIKKAIKERVAPNELKNAIEIKEIIENIKSIAKGEERLIVEEDDRYHSTPSESDQLAAARDYLKLSPPIWSHANEKQRLQLELVTAQVDVTRSKIDDGGGDQELLLKDLDMISGILNGDDE